MDSFNQSILELHSPADRWAYAMETGHLCDIHGEQADEVCAASTHPRGAVGSKVG